MSLLVKFLNQEPLYLDFSLKDGKFSKDIISNIYKKFNIKEDDDAELYHDNDKVNIGDDIYHR